MIKEYVPAVVSPEDRKIADDNFARWNSALLTRDAAKVAELYTEDCTFLPTVSDQFKMGQLGAQEYFKHFLEKNPAGKVVADAVQFFGTDSYLHSGMYNFELGPDSERKIVEARFSFVWKKDPQGQWLIAHHHSSVKPQV